ncbi:hypothetical protein GS399_04875 [Pedobacter sp. HMF7647]|uniref:Protease n=1 Tax=Hufsiella arboris TaxID=2695275 RepID=A0A7K1Y6U1_9SPHI|nr:hypothetical protein [Hufsiella arboris]MXV50296.1 hypothetical protein [Hufsiella arboris]
MIRQFFTVMATAAVLSAGCHTQKPVAQNDETRPVTAGSKLLKTRMATAGRRLTKDSALLSFTVTNNTSETQRFCKWETPFEPRLGKYFEVKDAQGNEALFRGAMARRVMPPPPEAYIEVPPHDSISTVVNLADNYSLTAEEYAISYTGGGVSGLQAGNKITFKLTRQ